MAFHKTVIYKAKGENIQHRDTQHGNFSNYDTSQKCDIKDTTGTKNLSSGVDNQLDNLSNNGNS